MGWVGLIRRWVGLIYWVGGIMIDQWVNGREGASSLAQAEALKWDEAEQESERVGKRGSKCPPSAKST